MRVELEAHDLGGHALRIGERRDVEAREPVETAAREGDPLELPGEGARRHLPVERRLLRRKSWVRELWFATGKRAYRFITRRILHWEDNEGRGPKP